MQTTSLSRPVFVMPSPLNTLIASACLLLASYGSALAADAPAAPAVASASASAAQCPALLQKTVPRLQDDAPQNLCQFAGKVLLVVNTASYCGFTSQYEGLEKLYADLNPAGLVVLGFPSNDFGGQEPGDKRQISEFCFNTYGVKFPMFEKSKVVGAGASPFYKDLIQASGKTPKWNFYKYLIGRNGKVLGTYSSFTTAQDKDLLADIHKALKTP